MCQHFENNRLLLCCHSDEQLRSFIHHTSIINEIMKIFNYGHKFIWKTIKFCYIQWIILYIHFWVELWEWNIWFEYNAIYNLKQVTGLFTNFHQAGKFLFVFCLFHFVSYIGKKFTKLNCLKGFFYFSILLKNTFDFKFLSRIIKYAIIKFNNMNPDLYVPNHMTRFEDSILCSVSSNQSIHQSCLRLVIEQIVPI